MPVIPPPAAVAPPPPPTVDPTTGVVTLPPITITPTPSSNTIPQWDNSWPVPDVSGVAIPSNYAAQSSESQSIQSTLNAWAMAVAADTVPYVPLTTDGLYGPHTQAVVACFQVWANQTKNAGLAVDGLAGPDTQNYLLDFLPPGTSFPTDGGY
jgi:peptidoglycan hydrolase-like protein with peptidoglycan-binding domain